MHTVITGVIGTPLHRRLARFREYKARGYTHLTGPYQVQFNADDAERTFYHDSDFAPGLRHAWADDIARSIQHRGWYCDAYQSDTIRGLVLRLPHGRGFLAGWSMGEGMASGLDKHIYADELSAALAADSYAERIAELNREAQDDDTEE